MSRLEKVNELIKQELGKIILENLEFEPGVMVTVLRVETSESLEDAKVWVSIFPEGKRGSTLEILKQRIGELQRLLNRKVALHFVPKITFKIDESTAHIDELDQLFQEIEEIGDIDKKEE